MDVRSNLKCMETILEVKLDKPILPKSKVVFDMEFEAQVPLQIRRSGRDNPGTRSSLLNEPVVSEDLCEYDYEGWHPTPYVAREFYGVWGDFDVTYHIDKNYICLEEPVIYKMQIRSVMDMKKQEQKLPTPAGNKLTWHFIAPNVHDFMWAADPELYS